MNLAAIMASDRLVNSLAMTELIHSAQLNVVVVLSEADVSPHMPRHV